MQNSNTHEKEIKFLSNLRTEADDGRQIGELGIADALRDGEARDGDAGEEVILKELEGIFWCPFKHGHIVFEGGDDPGQGCLVLKLPKGVIREQGLLEGGDEDGAEAP